jgi:hypothetical protein
MLLTTNALSSLAWAGDREEIPILRDRARPEIGEWIGMVSWNDPIVRYGWSVYPDGVFTSGRVGRGQNGGGTWGTHGSQLTLKYHDGPRYVGDVHGNFYFGYVYATDGRALGSFWMHRSVKAPIEEDHY